MALAGSRLHHGGMAAHSRFLHCSLFFIDVSPNLQATSTELIYGPWTLRSSVSEHQLKEYFHEMALTSLWKPENYTAPILDTPPCEQSAPEKATIRGHGRLRFQVAGQRWALGTGHRNKDCQCSNLNRVLSPLGTPGCVNMIILSTRSVIWVMGLVTTMWLRECYISGKGEWPSNKRQHLQEA